MKPKLIKQRSEADKMMKLFWAATIGAIILALLTYWLFTRQLNHFMGSRQGVDIMNCFLGAVVFILCFIRYRKGLWWLIEKAAILHVVYQFFKHKNKVNN